MDNVNRQDRRSFLRTAAATAAALTAATAPHGRAFAGQAPAPPASADKRIRKAVKFEMVAEKISIEEKFKLLKELGYDGVELPAPNNYDLKEVLHARDKAELPIHGVVNSQHWKDTHILSSPDPKVRAAGVETMKQAIRDAKAYGGTSMLLVVGRVDKQTSYDQAYERSQAAVREVVPFAEEIGIQILFENVWNNFLLSPLEAARYVDEFSSPAVGFYFDVGNVVRFGWPDQWIRILGKRIGKLDIKEYSREKQKNEGLWKGFNVELTEGDCDWPAVMKALREIDYRGWGTAEVPGGDRERLAFIAERMDRAFAG
jgi:hexulose-6-phosphate isomerase